MREGAALLERSGTYFHVDAALTYGKEIDSLRSLSSDFLSVSGHKIYGPKGVGALVARRQQGQRRPLTPLMVGGGQEMGWRPGTLPVPLIVGLGAAAELAGREHAKRREGAAAVKAALLDSLAVADHLVNGDQTRCLTHVLNVSFPGVESEALMLAVREQYAFSNGAACTSTTYAPSHVLTAMGLDTDRIATAIRLSWGPGIAAIPTAPLLEAIHSLRL